jgi:hypothetical protein
MLKSRVYGVHPLWVLLQFSQQCTVWKYMGMNYFDVFLMCNVFNYCVVFFLLLLWTGGEHPGAELQYTSNKPICGKVTCLGFWVPLLSWIPTNVQVGLGCHWNNAQYFSTVLRMQFSRKAPTKCILGVRFDLQTTQEEERK